MALWSNKLVAPNANTRTEVGHSRWIAKIRQRRHGLLHYPVAQTTPSGVHHPHAALTKENHRRTVGGTHYHRTARRAGDGGVGGLTGPFTRVRHHHNPIPVHLS